MPHIKEDNKIITTNYTEITAINEYAATSLFQCCVLLQGGGAYCGMVLSISPSVHDYCNAQKIKPFIW